MTPAREVGGDFYDFFLVDAEHLAIVIADVSGKGGSLRRLFMVIAKTLIKNHAQTGMEPGRVFETVNNQLCENNETGMFVTAFLGVLELSTGRFTYVNAGHNPPLVALGAQPYDWLPANEALSSRAWRTCATDSKRLCSRPGDRIFLYTDGVTEALNPDNALYSEARLKAFFNESEPKDRPLDEMLALLHQDIAAFAGGAEQADDITMLLLRINTINGRDENG